MSGWGRSKPGAWSRLRSIFGIGGEASGGSRVTYGPRRWKTPGGPSWSCRGWDPRPRRSCCCSGSIARHFRGYEHLAGGTGAGLGAGPRRSGGGAPFRGEDAGVGPRRPAAGACVPDRARPGHAARAETRSAGQIARHVLGRIFPHAHPCNERWRLSKCLLSLGHQPPDDLAHRQYLVDETGALSRKGHVLVESTFRDGCLDLPAQLFDFLNCFCPSLCPLIVEGVRRARGTVPYPARPIGDLEISFQSSTLIASSDWAAMISFFHPSAMGASTDARKRVPMFTPAAPSSRAAAMPRPSPIPPAATTGSGRTASTTCGMSGSVLTNCPKPPASPPWAITASTPRPAA